MKKYLKHVTKGTIYNWNEAVLANGNVVEVTEEEAFPERFIPKKARGRKPKVVLDKIEIPEEPDTTPPELAADASRGL